MLRTRLNVLVIVVIIDGVGGMRGTGGLGGIGGMGPIRRGEDLRGVMLVGTGWRWIVYQHFMHEMLLYAIS